MVRVKVRVAVYYARRQTYLYTYDISSEDEAQKLEQSLEKFTNSLYGDGIRYFYFGNIGICARDREFKSLLSTLEEFTKIKFCLQNDDKPVDTNMSLILD